MRYDVTTHPLLSNEARALHSEVLRQHNEFAEELLGLLEVGEYTDPADVARVQRALVRQINWQVQLDPDALVLKSKTVGARSETYKDVTLLDVYSLQLLEPLLPITDQKPKGKWEPIRSLRDDL